MMRPLELYIHIPFCIKKCAYCDFLSAPAAPGERQKYVEELCREILSYEKLAGAYSVGSIFVGGGTPSILAPAQIRQIFAAVRQVFAVEEDAEITMEMNPGTVTREKLSACRMAGVNRLSIGLQSADPEELKTLGRIHTYEDFLVSYRMVREAGFSQVNVDLMSAIPGQTVKSWENTLRKTAALSPEHISAYSLSIEEGTPFYEKYGPEGRPDALPGEEEERQMYHDTKRILGEYGYDRYEISNYAKPGCECRHNLGYWDRAEYLGIGAGAASFMDHRRWKKGEEPEILSPEEEMAEYMFLGLRKTKGVSISRFKEEFGRSMEEIYGEVLADMKKKALLEEKSGFIRLTERGLDISNYVMCEFL